METTREEIVKHRFAVLVHRQKMELRRVKAGDEHDHADIAILGDFTSITMQAHRDVTRHAGSPEWVAKALAEPLEIADALIRERVKELQEEARIKHAKALATELDRLASTSFSYTVDPKLSILENAEREGRAREEFRKDPHRVLVASKNLAEAGGALYSAVGPALFEGQATREVRAEYPHLFAPYESAETLAAARTVSKRTSSAWDLARSMLATRADVKFTGKPRIVARAYRHDTNGDVDGLAAELLTTYAAHGAEVAGLDGVPQLERAKVLARATLSLDADQRPRFLTSIMRAAGIA